jgi:hypothetical protein
MTLMEMFQEGGFAMYWILLLGLGALAMGVVHAAMARKWSLIVSAILLALIAGIALLGTMDGRHKVENGIVGVEPELKARMLAQGYKEAMRPVQFGGIVVGLAGALVVVGEVRRRKRPQPPR